MEGDLARTWGVEHLAPRRRARFYLHASDVTECAEMRNNLTTAAAALIAAHPKVRK